MKKYNFDNKKSYLFIAPTSWGKTMGVIIPAANEADDVLLFAALNSEQESLLSPFVTYIRGSIFSAADNKKRVDELIALAKVYPFSRIIIDEVSNLLDSEDMIKILELSTTRNIPLLFALQSLEQAHKLGINCNAFEVIDVEEAVDEGFTNNDYKSLYATEGKAASSETADIKENIMFIKKKAANNDTVVIDFDGFISTIATYTVLSPGRVIDILKGHIIPDVVIK